MVTISHRRHLTFPPFTPSRTSIFLTLFLSYQSYMGSLFSRYSYLFSSSVLFDFSTCVSPSVNRAPCFCPPTLGFRCLSFFFIRDSCRFVLFGRSSPSPSAFQSRKDFLAVVSLHTTKTFSHSLIDTSESPLLLVCLTNFFLKAPTFRSVRTLSIHGWAFHFSFLAS